MTQEYESDDMRELRREQLLNDNHPNDVEDYDEETQELIREYVNDNQYIAFF